MTDESPTTSPRTRMSNAISWQAIRYLLVAGVTALVYLALIAGGLAIGLHYFIAILVAQVITIAGAFPAYRQFVFQSKSTVWLDFVRFLGVWSTGAIAGLVLTPVLVEFAHVHPLIAQIFAIGALSVLSFLAHRFFTFRPKRTVDDATDDPASGDLPPTTTLS